MRVPVLLGLGDEAPSAFLLVPRRRWTSTLHHCQVLIQAGFLTLPQRKMAYTSTPAFAVVFLCLKAMVGMFLSPFLVVDNCCLLTWYKAHSSNRGGFLPFPLVQLLLPTFSQPQISLASLLFPKIVNLCINPKDWRVCSSRFHTRDGLEEVARFHLSVPCPSV